MSIWIKELLKNLDEKVDTPTRKSILGACGEKCPFTHFPDDKLLNIKNESKDDNAFFEKLCDQWRLKNENGKYYVVFDKCYCRLVNKNLEGTSQSLSFYNSSEDLNEHYSRSIEKSFSTEQYSSLRHR